MGTCIWVKAKSFCYFLILPLYSLLWNPDRILLSVILHGIWDIVRKLEVGCKNGGARTCGRSCVDSVMEVVGADGLEALLGMVDVDLPRVPVGEVAGSEGLEQGLHLCGKIGEPLLSSRPYKS